MDFWIKEPNKDVKSVSLTLLVFFGILAAAANILAVFKQVQTTSGLDNLFWGALALYFGRRNVSVGGKQFSAGDADISKEKVND